MVKSTESARMLHGTRQQRTAAGLDEEPFVTV